MTETWRVEIRNWAQQVTQEFQQRDGVIGVMIGGSIARGQEWPHSDLELGVLVNERITSMPYFNVIQGRGVEAIQVVSPSLQEQFEKIQHGDVSPISKWPIQLWLGNVVHDPTGVFSTFKEYFDSGLFTESVLQMKMDLQREKIRNTLAEAKEFLNQQKPLAALARTRYAMNEAILALHWHYHELPRSQNRTDSRLKALCEKHENPDFYKLYREIFSLENSDWVLQNVWPEIRDDVLDITRMWIGGAYDFFKYAVDSNFEWGQNGGILTVYRLYIPIIGGEQSLMNKMDDPDWAEKHQSLLSFLGMDKGDSQTVEGLIQKLTETSQENFGKN